MGFLIKTFLVILGMLAIGIFLISYIPALRNNVVEVVNPSIQVGKILGEMTANLNNLDNTIGGLDNSNNSTYREKVEKSKEILAKSKNLLDDASRLNDQSSGLTGIIGRQAGDIIGTVINQISNTINSVPVNSVSPNPNCFR